MGLTIKLTGNSPIGQYKIYINNRTKKYSRYLVPRRGGIAIAKKIAIAVIAIVLNNLPAVGFRALPIVTLAIFE